MSLSGARGATQRSVEHMSKSGRAPAGNGTDMARSRRAGDDNDDGLGGGGSGGGSGGFSPMGRDGSGGFSGSVARAQGPGGGSRDGVLNPASGGTSLMIGNDADNIGLVEIGSSGGSAGFGLMRRDGSTGWLRQLWCSR